MSDKEFDLPQLGPADEERANAGGRNSGLTSEPSRQSIPTSAKTKGGSGGFLTWFFILILVAATSGLGYFGYMMHMQLKAEQASVAELQRQMAGLQELLNAAESSAQASGTTMLERLSAVTTRAEQQYQLYDSEVAKLWDLAHKKNTPAITENQKALVMQSDLVALLETRQAEMNKSLGELKTSFTQETDSLAKAIDALNTQLTGQISASQQDLTAALSEALKADLAKSAEALSAEQKAALDEMAARISASERSVQLAEEAVMEEVDALVSLQRKHGDRITAMEAKGVDKSLETRISGVESSVKAFDSSRRELSRTLLQVRQKINNLQLQIEKK